MLNCDKLQKPCLWINLGPWFCFVHNLRAKRINKIDPRPDEHARKAVSFEGVAMSQGEVESSSDESSDPEDNDVGELAPILSWLICIN
jgi:hypothetical protein